MTFSDALEMMRRGSPVRRPGWPSDVWVYCTRGDLWHRTGEAHRRANLSNKDILATDWELLGQPQAAAPAKGEPLGGIQQKTLAEVDRSAA